MSGISLNVIVYNEEDRLERCLLDARPYVDEIVVVDQMSTDRTPGIAQRLADVFLRDIHHGHAEPSRELAASRSSGDWLLILDADEVMSDLLKAQLRSLTEGDVDGYWIRKTNLIDGVEASSIHHLRLVRASRATFDPRPHGGAHVVTGHVATFDDIGIVHAKTAAEQLYDDARYEQIAAEERAPSSSKRNWLQHNLTLRAHREQARRTDLEALVPRRAERVLVVGGLPVELPAPDVVHVASLAEVDAAAVFDAVLLTLQGAEDATALRAAAGLVVPGGVVAGVVAAARNLRRLERVVAGVVRAGGSDGTVGDPCDDPLPAGGSTRAALLDDLTAAGLDPRWLRLVGDGWLDPPAVRPDGRGNVVESGDFLLRDASAEVAEELAAGEIVFAAVRRDGGGPATCSVVVAPLFEGDAEAFATALAATSPTVDYELVVVHPVDVGSSPSPGELTVEQTANLATRWNLGARAASGDHLVFVAGAAEPEVGWLDGLVDVQRSRPDAGAIGSKIIATDGTVEHVGLVAGPDGIPFRAYEGHDADVAHAGRLRIMPAVAATGALVSRSRFVGVGGFDEDLAEDLADADLCLRLRSRGHAAVIAPSCVLHSHRRAVHADRSAFRRSVREFTARWPSAAGSSWVVAAFDGLEGSAEWNRSWRLPLPSVAATDGLPAVAWSGHFFEHGGYTEEAIGIVEALDDAGVRVVVNPVTYDRRYAPMPAPNAQRLAALVDRPLPDDFVHVAHIGADRFKRHPTALRSIGRTMFETDSLPPEWRDRCNLMDEIWVPAEFNLHTFARAGVEVSKLHVVPETFDATVFRPDVAPLEIDGLDALDGYVFLSVFSWIGRKAWDVLLRAWFEEFSARDDVTLVLKTDAALAPQGTDCRREVERFVRDRLGKNPKKGARVVVLDRLLDAAEMPSLFRAADAFVLPSHGEGWGRPYMEAMAMGLPTIATRWSGNLDFMDDGNSLLVDYELVDTPDEGLQRGQRWAQPLVKDVRRKMRQLVDDPQAGVALGARARADVLVRCAPERVVDAVRERLDSIDRHPVHVAVATAAAAPTHGSTTAEQIRRVPAAGRPRDGRRVTACVLVGEDRAHVRACLASIEGVVDDVVVVEAGPDEDRSRVRNAGLDQVHGGWVLALEASHTLDPSSRGLVRDLVRVGGATGYTAQVRRQIDLDGTFAAVEEPVAVLFPHDPNLRYLGPIDEQLVPIRPDRAFRLVPSSLFLHQHDPRPERVDGGVRARAHLPRLERAVKDQPDEPFHRWNLGRALGRLGLHREAETMLRAAVELAPARTAWAAAAHVALARAVGAQGRKAEAVKLCKRATALAPEWAEGWCALGAAREEVGRPEKALAAYRKALDCLEDGPGVPGCLDDVGWAVRGLLARLHVAREDHQAAAEVLAPAVFLRPADGDLRVLLAQVEAALGNSAGARRQLESAMAMRAGPDACLRFAEHFATLAHNAMLRGLADNAEHPLLLERIRAMRTSGLVS